MLVWAQAPSGRNEIALAVAQNPPWRRERDGQFAIDKRGLFCCLVEKPRVARNRAEVASYFSKILPR